MLLFLDNGLRAEKSVNGKQSQTLDNKYNIISSITVQLMDSPLNTNTFKSLLLKFIKFFINLKLLKISVLLIKS